MQVRKQRVYYGCEIESPIYRQIIKENGMKIEGGNLVENKGNKRGKRRKKANETSL